MKSGHRIAFSIFCSKEVTHTMQTQGRQHAAAIIPLFLWGLVGFGSGLINGLLGAAGGILLVAALPRLPAPTRLSLGADPFSTGHLDQRDLFATALAVMLPISAVSAFNYWRSGIRPELRFTLFLLLPVAVGGFVGGLLLERTSQTFLRRLFAAVILVSGVRMLF